MMVLGWKGVAGYVHAVRCLGNTYFQLHATFYGLIQKYPPA